MVRLIDLSGDIESGQPVYPGQTSTQFWVAGTHEESAYSTLRRVGEETASVRRKLKAEREGDGSHHPIARTILIGEHGPTHVDSLSHVDPTSDGTIDNLPLERFYGDAVGVDVSHVGDGFISIEDIQSSLEEHDLELRDDDAITLFTGHRNAHYVPDDVEKRFTYFYDAPGLDEDAAYWLGEQGVTNVGIDGPSIDHGSALNTGEYPAHDMCAEYEVLNMENMENLEAVVGTRYTLCGFPLKLIGGTGSPIRPVAILDE